MRQILIGLLALLVAVPASAGYWENKQATINKRALDLLSLEVNYELERMQTPPGATIPKHKQLAIVYPKERVFDLAKNAKKANAVNLAITAAVTAAGWSIDELTRQVTEPSWIDPPLYQSGYAWVTSGYHASMPDVSCQLWGDAINRPYTSITYYSPTRYNCNTRATPSGSVATYNTNQEADSLCTGNYCEPPEQIEGTPTVVPDPAVVDQVMPYLDQLPDYQLDDILKDERGIPITTPELKAAINAYNQDLADNDPNLTWDPVTGKFTYTDPDTLDVTEWDADPKVNENQDNSASDQDTQGEDWPDFCDWTSGAGLCDTETAEQPSYQGVLDAYGNVESNIGLIDTPLPSLWSFPVAFGGAAACQGIPFDFDRSSVFGNISIHFVLDKHCEIAATIINPVLAWFFALLTVWFCMETYREETMRGF